MSAYMGVTRGSGVLSSAGDVLEMCVVRGVGGVCDLCMCLVWGGVGCVGVGWLGERNGFGVYQSWRKNGKSGICVCVLVAVVWVWVELGSGWAAWARVWDGGVVLCLCVL